MKRTKLARMVLLLHCLVLLVLSCAGGPSNPEDNCELVTQGISFLQIVNTSGDEIDVNFIGFAFGALITNDKCEIFGMPAGARAVDVKKSPDGPTTRVPFSIAVGETFTLRVTKDFF